MGDETRRRVDARGGTSRGREARRTPDESAAATGGPAEPVQLEEPTHGTGIAGLDDVLGGGLPAERLFVVEGQPGSGKTTLSLQFLLEGRARGERGLYVTL